MYCLGLHKSCLVPKYGKHSQTSALALYKLSARCRMLKRWLYFGQKGWSLGLLLAKIKRERIIIILYSNLGSIIIDPKNTFQLLLRVFKPINGED